MNSKRNSFISFFIIALLIASTLLYALKGHLLPIIAAIVLVYLTKPVLRLLRSFGLSDKTSASLISLSLFTIFFFIVFHGLPILISELSRIISQLPSNIETTYNLLNEILKPYDITLETNNLPKTLTQSLNIQDLKALQHIPTLLSSTVGRFIDIILFFTSLLFIPLFFFFAIQHNDDIYQTMISVIPPSIRSDIADFIVIINDTLSTWIAGQGGVIISLSILYATGLMLIGTPYAITLGVITGLLYIIPVVGPLLALVLITTVTIASSGINSWILGQIFGLFILLQVIEGLVLSPLLIGNKLGLNLPSLLFAILVGGGLMGGYGVILAAPVAAILRRTFIMIEQKKSAEWLYD